MVSMNKLYERDTDDFQWYQDQQKTDMKIEHCDVPKKN